MEEGLTIEEVDALTGPLIGLPKSASYRLLDIVGLDVWAHVTKNLYDLVPGDPWRERFVLPPFFAQMIERGWLGEKTGQGFYKRVGKGDKKEILALDLKTLEYHPSKKARFASIEGVRNIEDLPQRLRALMALDRPRRHVPVEAVQRPGALFGQPWCRRFPIAWWRSTAPCAGATPIRWARSSSGTRWASKTPSRACESEAAPDSGERREDAVHRREILLPGRRPRTAARTHEYFDLLAKAYKRLEDRPGITVLKDVKRARGVVKKNAGASLIDLGDGVLCVEFHSKMNSLGEDQISMIRAGIEETSQELRRHGHRQPGRELQRRRQPDAGAAGRAGRGVGRAGRRHPPLPAGQHG